MITPHTLTREWILQVSREHEADTGLVEKLNRALYLLEGLVESNLDFIFKGGTALVLHFNASRRLSIDIDIVMPNQSDLLNVVKEIAQKKQFIDVQAQPRLTNDSIQKAHYKFYYTSTMGPGSLQYILLDVLFAPIGYSNIVKLPITASFLNEEGVVLEVAVPSIEDLLGDKMTAFAPNTTGIPYFKKSVSSSMEIIKQLYDIGQLFDSAHNIGNVAQTFEKLATQQLSYRNLDSNIEKVLDDIHDTALIISSKGAEGKGKNNYDELLKGVTRIKSYIFSESYHIEKAIIQASKAAYLAALIRSQQVHIQRFTDPEALRDWEIKQPFPTKLNKLKKTNPEAFFYWYQVSLFQSS